MALPNYGVLIGTYNRFEKDPASMYGNWYHGFLYLNVNGVEYKCAVDVNSPTGNFTYMMLGGLDNTMFTNISGLSNGYHELIKDASSGAIDYNRSPFVNKAKGCLALILGIFNSIFRTNKEVWKTNAGDDALNKLNNLASTSERIYVFGEPFNTGDGMHNIHYNQGDPINSQWHDTNGIWQDGCVIVKKPGEDKLSGYFGKFVSQSFNTDNNGWPI